MPTAAQRQKHARSQARYAAKKKAKAEAAARQAETRFEEGNIAAIVHGAKTQAENLPAEYQVIFALDTPSSELIEVLDTMRGAALVMLDALKECGHLDSLKMTGHYQQLISRLVKMSGQISAGKIKPAPWGDLSAGQVEQAQRDLARALSAGITKMQWQYPWLTEHGLVSEYGAFYRAAVEGLASTLAGSATTIETWMMIRQWQENKNAKGSNAYINAARAASARRG
jgi:hypothetical protein